MTKFRYELIKGQIAKEIVRGLFEDAGYIAYSFGYESLMSQIRNDVQKQLAALTDSIKRLRSMPDLLIYENEGGAAHFVEVKFRKVNQPQIKLKTEPLLWYYKYWNDSILVTVIPSEHSFYAQYINKLDKIRYANKYYQTTFDLTKEFVPIEQIFPRITSESIKNHQQLLERFVNMRAYQMDQDGPNF